MVQPLAGGRAAREQVPGQQQGGLVRQGNFTVEGAAGRGPVVPVGLQDAVASDLPQPQAVDRYWGLVEGVAAPRAVSAAP
jgi:hypothetical protein